jgi:hypothetical protein
MANLTDSDQSMPDSGEPSSEICVPMEEVMIGGVPPGLGDTIQIPAKVTRIEGDNVYAEPEGMGEKKGQESLEQEGARLRATAQDTSNPGY